MPSWAYDTWHWSKKTEVYVPCLCCGIQLETDPVEVKEELMPLISPAVTWGKKEDKKTRKRLMYNAESALKPVGNNDSLHTPHCSLSISIRVPVQKHSLHTCPFVKLVDVSFQ